MEPDRREQIETLFYQALELDEPERAAFLAKSCSDQNLRQEIEKNLLFHEKSRDLIDTRLFNESATLFATQQNQLSFGQKIGSYQILKMLGAGGMGEVYLAEDTRLGRKVALKVLSPNFVSVPNVVSRFQQEARAASALNHPNILTIYEVGQEKSVYYIAAEFIDGVTLRQIFTKRQMSLDETLDIALQITSALTAAHQAGIVHRDIKPQNIMVRQDGYVKVLDFGIAKLIEGQFQNKKLAASPNTFTGTIIGTANYMSPEQARGLNVDVRTDIWSLGVTLYEMVTRQIPFKGQTTSDVIVSILEREPLSLADLAYAAPPQLDEIIKRCIDKNVDQRYQNVTELAEDLYALQQQIHVSMDSSGSHINPTEPNKLSAQSYKPPPYKSLNYTPTKQLPANVQTKRIRINFAKIKNWYLYLAIILLTFAVGFLFFGDKSSLPIKTLFTWTNNSAVPFQINRINRLTNTGNVVFANVSPDSKFIAYIIQEAEQQSLWIRQVSAAPAKLRLPSSDNLYKGLTFSPDSNFIYYVIHEKAKGKGVLYAVSTLGGEPRKILEDVDSPVTFAPDGKSFAFMRGISNAGASAHALLIADTEGNIQKSLAVYQDPDFFSRDGCAWSPDGKIIIAATIKTSDSAVKQMSLVAIEVSDGTERPFSSQTWQEINSLSWLGNGKSLVMTALGAKSGPQQIYQISYPEGEVQAITKDLNGYQSVSVTSDARNIVAIESDRSSHIWTAPTGNINQIKRITPGIGRYYQSSWTPDNKIIYISEESGSQEVWRMEADGSNAKQLTFDAAMASHPKMSRDGRYVIFASNRSGALHLWRMDPDGTNLLQLTNGNSDSSPEISPDNKLVYYTSYISGKEYISSVSIDGGNSNRVFDFPALHGKVSPDGKNMLCLFLDENVNSKWQIGIASLSEKKIVQTLKITDAQRQFLTWTPNGQAITYTNSIDNLHNLWNYPLNGEPAKQQTHFDSSDQIFYFDWSSDGKNFIYLRGQRTDDVVFFNGSDR